MSWSEALDARIALRGVLADERWEWPGEGPPIEQFVDGDAIWLGGDICDVAMAGLRTWRAEPLLATDVLCARGFMLLEKPFSVWQPHDGKVYPTVTFAALAWVVTDGGVWAQMFIPAKRLRPVTPIDELAEENRGPTAAGLSFVGHRWLWPWGEPPNDGGAVNTYLQIIWRLAQQRITTHERQPADRASRRRATRAGCDDPYVTVITLRHTQRPRDGEPSAVDWAHRWIVGGHWRNQWYPSIEAHRQIWIAPHVKGPEDKDLRLRDARAISFVR